MDLFSAIFGWIWLRLRWTFDLGNGHKSTKFQPNLLTTFEGNSRQPKPKGRGLIVGDWQKFRIISLP